jgi:drug/metabolite transporter (DMT)-like permease
MSRSTLAVVLALITCVGWGLATPLIMRLSRQFGPGEFHPLLPFTINAIGNFIIVLVWLSATSFSPLKFWSWHWSSWALMVLWPLGGLAFVLAIHFAPEKSSTLNAIAATYPVIISMPVLWYFLGEIMTTQKVIGIFVAVLGVIIAILG